MKVLVVIVLALGCGKGVDQRARCRVAAEQGVAALVARAKERLATSGLTADVRAKIEQNMRQLDDIAPRLRAVIMNRCTDDQWPNAVIECYARATAFDEMRACREHLPATQQDKLQRAELDLMTGGTAEPPGFTTTPPASSPEIAKLQAELNGLNTQLAEASKQITAATSDAEREAAKAKVAAVQAQMQAVSDKLAAARAQPVQ